MTPITRRHPGVQEATGMDIHVHQERLPGIGQRYEFAISDDRHLVVVARSDGGRDLSLTDHSSDDAQTVLTLDRSQAATLGGLLIGATFTIDATEEGGPTDDVIVKTITLGSAAPVLGQAIAGIDLTGHAQAVVLALIRDTTADLVEDPATCGCQPGDRLVIVAHSDHIDAVTQLLTRTKP